MKKITLFALSLATLFFMPIANSQTSAPHPFTWGVDENNKKVCYQRVHDKRYQQAIMLKVSDDKCAAEYVWGPNVLAKGDRAKLWGCQYVTENHDADPQYDKPDEIRGCYEAMAKLPYQTDYIIKVWQGKDRCFRVKHGTYGENDGEFNQLIAEDDPRKECKNAFQDRNPSCHGLLGSWANSCPTYAPKKE